MLSIQPDNPDSQDLDIERPGDVPAFKKATRKFKWP